MYNNEAKKNLRKSRVKFNWEQSLSSKVKRFWDGWGTLRHEFIDLWLLQKKTWPNKDLHRWQQKNTPPNKDLQVVRRTYPRQEATTQTDETEPSHDSDDPSGQAFGQVWSQIQGEGKSFSRIFQNQAYVWLYIILECAIIHQSLSLDNQTGASPASSPATGFTPH